MQANNVWSYVHLICVNLLPVVFATHEGLLLSLSRYELPSTKRGLGGPTDQETADEPRRSFLAVGEDGSDFGLA